LHSRLTAFSRCNPAANILNLDSTEVDTFVVGLCCTEAPSRENDLRVERQHGL
jgi:hypothetical protein